MGGCFVVVGVGGGFLHYDTFGDLNERESMRVKKVKLILEINKCLFDISRLSWAKYRDN